MRFLLERLKRPDSGHRATQNNPRSGITYQGRAAADEAKAQQLLATIAQALA